MLKPSDIKLSNNYLICGIDESGRGALAGPLVAAAVVINRTIKKKLDKIRTPLKDGKLLLPKQRRKIYQFLKSTGAEIKIDIISTRRINNRGIQRANREVIRNLIKQIEADQYIVDGNIKLGRIKGKTSRVKTVVDADAKILPVILAGIVAKVERDKLMKQLHRQYPNYKWHRNAGYGTKVHISAIKQHGICLYHRHIFVHTALGKLD